MSRARALISVSNKRGLPEFAGALVGAGFELVSTGGTYRVLKDAGLPVLPVEEITGHPEILDGRVKTLHPQIHGGILFRRGDKDHHATLNLHQIGPIDVVVVNLYPFEATIARHDVANHEAIENIDIGGPTLVRAAAKAANAVTVIVDPDDYGRVGEALCNDNITPRLRKELALKAFRHTSRYDQAIAAWMQRQLDEENDATPDLLPLNLRCSQVLRYGENPHQVAGLYHTPNTPELGGIYGPMTLLSGKALSYNNVLDLDAAVGLVAEFDAPAAAVIKHTNPAGCATVEKTDSEKDAILAAYLLARSGDPISAFGGIVALNCPVHAELASALKSTFLEVIVAPHFEDEALAILQRKKNLRLLQAPGLALGSELSQATLRVRTLGVGTLVQSCDANLRSAGLPTFEPATNRAPDDSAVQALRFLWRVCKHIRSNAIVIGGADTPTDWPQDNAAPTGFRTYGVGAGQMSRVDAVRLAITKATHPLEGSSLASDAFFPFPDGLEIAAEAGVTNVIQPGGSKGDANVIEAANAHNVAMVFTGKRHFRH